MAGLYHGHLLEFPQIRVDCFTRTPTSERAWRLPSPTGSASAPAAQIYLLTHVHTDHLIGLSDTFTGQIVCSPDTKRLLLKLESEKERGLVVEGTKDVGTKKYARLKARVEGKGTKDERLVDRIETIPYGVPKMFELGYDNGQPHKVTITLLDANHCPGSAMFLITSPLHAVLHTGDLRADRTFLQSLRRNPAVGEFMVPWTKTPSGYDTRKRLDRIYLDTSTVLGTGDMPEKEEVIRDLLEQMSMYPQDTTFFLNVWCFGWEDVVKEVARHFNSKVHVDRYKYECYRAVKTDPFLFLCVTHDPAATRFHACDRKAKCDECRKFDKNGLLAYNLDKRVVSVNMVEIKSASWELEKREFMDRLGSAAVGQGGWPFNIDCPFARHSPLPELQALVRMFRPKSLSPNTMVPQYKGMDYYLLPDLFQDGLDETATLIKERDDWFTANPKYGKAYLENMKVGVSTMPQIQIESETVERYREPFEVTVGPTQRGRRAATMDQLSRIGPTSGAFFPAEMVSDLNIGAMIRKMPGLEQGSLSMSFTGRRLDESEYDTEEESLREKRRRVSGYTNENTSTPSPQTNGTVLGGRLIPHTHITNPSTRPVETGVKVGPEIKVEASSPPVPCSSKPSASMRKPFRQFSVNKEHLRALAMVAAEVDDL